MSCNSLAVIFTGLLGFAGVGMSAEPEPLKLTLRSAKWGTPPNSSKIPRSIVAGLKYETWHPNETAIIVCDVWDLHHCRNAVRRVEQFAPRLNAVLAKCRELGITVIHAPSDCMPAYADHPARRRAIDAPKAANAPEEITQWCSVLPSELDAQFPIDQSDGGEDNDPTEHAAWAAHLKSLGRNPGMPWKTQTDLLTIDETQDYISDRGDEVWNILEARGIKNVMLAGVHTNMCVLGRPFGLRNMVRGGKRVTLIRDLTDSMYNPQRWPYVSHFVGHELVLRYVEQYVCPTIVSSQLVEGKPIQFDGAPAFSHQWASSPEREALRAVPSKEWRVQEWPQLVERAVLESEHPLWLRCTLWIPSAAKDSPLTLLLPAKNDKVQAWINGKPLKGTLSGELSAWAASIQSQDFDAGDANLLVVRYAATDLPVLTVPPPAVVWGSRVTPLAATWQFRRGDDPAFSNMPLPAKFGTMTDIVYHVGESPKKVPLAGTDGRD